MFTAWPDGLGLVDLVNIFGSMIDYTPTACGGGKQYQYQTERL